MPDNNTITAHSMHYLFSLVSAATQAHNTLHIVRAVLVFLVIQVLAIIYNWEVTILLLIAGK